MYSLGRNRKSDCKEENLPGVHIGNLRQECAVQPLYYTIIDPNQDLCDIRV